MSIRVKIATLFGLVIAFMTLLMNYSAETGQLEKHPLGTSMWTITKGLFVLDVIGLIVAALVLMSWRDIPHKRIVNTDENYTLGWLLMLVGGIVALYFFASRQKGEHITIILNNTSNITNGTALANYHPLNAHGFGNVTNTTATGSIPPDYLLYTGFIIIALGFIYFGVVYYRDALKKRKRKEMREKALKFDRKVEELGLDAFSDPKEAVVRIYKNAVLWLEVLGIPYSESWTHWEHVEHVNIFRKAFTTLTRLFEKAKYAPERVTWEDAKRALEVYRRMRGVIDED